MESNKIYGILSLILGLIFIIFPIFSTAFTTILIGISLIFFGIALILSEFLAFNIIIGILAVIFGLIFATNIAALAIFTGLQFYIIGAIMILAGITGLISGSQISKVASILIILLGIVSFALGGLSLGNPLFATILIGVGLIVQGIRLYME